MTFYVYHFTALPGQGSAGAACGLSPPVPSACRPPPPPSAPAGPITPSITGRMAKPAGPVGTGPAGETIPV